MQNYRWASLIGIIAIGFVGAAFGADEDLEKELEKLNVRPIRHASSPDKHIYGALFTDGQHKAGDFQKSVPLLKKLKKLAYLYTADVDFTDQDLAAVAQLSTLEDIKIPSPNVTDKGILQLKSLKKLTSLNVPQSKVTEAGARALMKELPALKEVEIANNQTVKRK